MPKYFNEPEVVSEGFFNKKKKTKEEKFYTPLTKDECKKILAIAKKCVAKYPKLKKISSSDDFNESMEEHVSKDKVESNDGIIILSGDLWDYPEFDRTRFDVASEDIESFDADFKKALEESGIKTKIDSFAGDWDDFIVEAYSRKPLESSTNESTEYINEVFGLSKKEKDQKHTLSDIEFGYDKKFNAFCLSVSSYSVDKLKDTLAKKQGELEAAKEEKKNASDRQGRLSAQLKIDYLSNVCDKCKAMIKKKEKYSK